MAEATPYSSFVDSLPNPAAYYITDNTQGQLLNKYLAEYEKYKKGTYGAIAHPVGSENWIKSERRMKAYDDAIKELVMKSGNYNPANPTNSPGPIGGGGTVNDPTQGTTLGTRTNSYEDFLQNYPEFRTNDVPVDYNDPESVLAALIRREEERRRGFYLPAEDKAIASLQDTTLMDNARERAESDKVNSGLRSARQRSRYMISGDPAQKAQASRLAALDRALGYGATLNQGRLAQDERNNALRQELVGVGRGIVNNAVSGFSGSAQAEADRYAANQLRKAQNVAGGLGTVGQVIGAGALVFSDVRLKQDVRKVGVNGDGLNLYKFRYKFDPEKEHVGVMGHEALLVRPDAVKRHDSGYLMVDYGKISIEAR